MKAAPAIIAAVVCGSVATAAHPALDFIAAQTRPSAPLDVRTDRVRQDSVRAEIKAANAAAARRHGVPVEFMDRLTQQESGFRFVKGPVTPWGRAHGPHQILCSTAASLGERDCNRLMHDAERSADLSARYVRMGYDATGSWHGAAAHYHGGSNRRMWGRKTAAYARVVGGQPVRYAVNRDRNAPIPASLTFGAGIVPSSGFAALAMVPQ
jgi:soluble lytic murein transglycosylase-like protein